MYHRAIWAFFALLLVSCAVPGHPQAPMPAGAIVPDEIVPIGDARISEDTYVKVTLDIFSGRPNPTWTLPSTVARGVRSKLTDLPITKAHDFPETLGYRGFWVEMKTGSGRASVLRVYGGFIKDRESYFLDKDRSIERELLESSKTLVDSDLYATVLEEIEKPGGRK